MRSNLTDRLCQSADCGSSSRIDLHDTNRNSWNLSLRVTKHKKLWYCRYRFGNSRPAISLGSYPSISLAEARQKSLQHGATVQSGIDPRRKIKEEKISNLTIAEVASEYIERHCRQHQKSWQETERMFRLHILPELGKVSIQNLRREHGIQLMDTLAEKGLTVQVNRVIAALKAFLNWAVEDRDLIEHNPVASINRGKFKRFREEKRTRVLSDSELLSIWNSTEVLTEVPAAIVRILILTGQRRDEVRLMSHDELDLQRGLWVLPPERTKSKRQHVVPLSDPVCAELKALNTSGRYVFSVNGETPYAGLKRVKSRLESESGITNWRFHDFRRTFSTSLSALKIPYRDRRLCLNHSVQDSLDDVYDQYDFIEEKRNAMDAWANRIQLITSQTHTGNLLSLAS